MSKKGHLPESIEKLKSQLEKENNIVDYFLVCGLNPSKCLDENLYDIFNQEQITKKKLTPEIISKFPPFDKSTITIDDGILQYCFIKGFDIKEVKTKEEPEVEFFSFVLDNQFFSYEFPQKYVTCCLFYESLGNYRRLQTKIENEGFNITASNQEINNFLSGNRKTSLSNIRSPYHKLLQFYIPKCICLISVYPNFEFHKKVLSLFKEYATQGIEKKLEIPIEKFIESLVIEVPLPPRGIHTIEYPLPNSDDVKNLKQSELNKLPLLDFTLPFASFEPKEIIEIYKHILFDTKLIFFSTDITNLCYIISGFMNILSPFKYPFQVVSIIPKDNYSIIESISPYIFGIREKYSDNFFEENGIDISESSILCIDCLEFKTILKDGTNEKFPKLPKKYYQVLEKNLFSIRKKNTKDINSKYLNCFFETNVNLFKNYEKYLNNGYYSLKDNIQNTNIKTLFKVKEFIESQSRDEREFFSKVVNDSQMFTDFIYRRMIPKNTTDKIETLFFNEKIAITTKTKFFSKKENKTFINSEEYQVKSKYAIAKQKELSKFEVQTILQKKESFLERGQYITIKGDIITFSYPFFPALLQEVFFDENNISNYNLPPNYADEIDEINADIVSKSLIAHEEGHSIEMENYIYLTWLELWGFSFWYIDKNERPYHFHQMIKVLDKVIHHEMEIFNLLFDVLSRQNEEDMILKLYKKLLNYKLNPSIFIHTIISPIFDRKQIQALKIRNESINEIQKEENEYNAQHLKFKKRTLRIFCEKTVLGESVSFLRYYPCIECLENLDLLKISKNFTKIKKDEVWAYCNNCKKYTLPKLIVVLGKEINTRGDDAKGNEAKTSTQYEVVLYSPYHLKVNVKEGISREYGVNLDIDLFKLKLQSLFWNAIWYFSIFDLDYEFLLPYEDHIFKLKQSSDDESEVTVKSKSTNKVSFNNDFKSFKNLEAIVVRELKDRWMTRGKFNNLEISYEHESETLQNVTFSFSQLTSNIKTSKLKGKMVEFNYVTPFESRFNDSGSKNTMDVINEYEELRPSERTLIFSKPRKLTDLECEENKSLLQRSTISPKKLANNKYNRQGIGKPYGNNNLKKRVIRKKSINPNNFNFLKLNKEEIISFQEKPKRRRSEGLKFNYVLFNKYF